MLMLNTTMLREKFVLHEGEDDADPMVAVGNRISLPLFSKTGQREERLVVRGQNMHTTLRMAAMIARTYYRDGPIQSRSPSFPWGPNWNIAMPDFEKQNNPDIWVSVYSGGRPIYKFGEYHPFLDVIEQCDARNRDEYDRAVSIAEDAFNMAGRGVRIDHQTTIAMVIGTMMDKTRVGLIFRNPKRTNTFNFAVEPKNVTREKAVAEPHQCLLHAAAWLELVQLSVQAGFLKARKGATRSNVTLVDVEKRLGKLNHELQLFEESYDVSYRPERPDTIELVEEATEFAKGS
ncbi:MAG: hypothetical protein KGQ41_01885 [Alphaproteobacteria bacterium]|nr:hypothetical protein [Alphaproteobacteria bacterium]